MVISGKLNARVNEDNCDYNLKDDDSYKILQKDFNKLELIYLLIIIKFY